MSTHIQTKLWTLSDQIRCWFFRKRDRGVNCSGVAKQQYGRIFLIWMISFQNMPKNKSLWSVLSCVVVWTPEWEDRYLANHNVSQSCKQHKPSIWKYIYCKTLEYIVINHNHATNTHPLYLSTILLSGLWYWTWRLFWNDPTKILSICMFCLDLSNY